MRISRVLRTCTCSGGSLGVRVLLEIRNSSGWTCMTVRCKTGPVCSVGLYCTLSKGASVWNCLGESVQAYVLFCHHRWENKTLFRWEENLCPICSTFFFLLKPFGTQDIPSLEVSFWSFWRFSGKQSPCLLPLAAAMKSPLLLQPGEDETHQLSCKHSLKLGKWANLQEVAQWLNSVQWVGEYYLSVSCSGEWYLR